MQTEQSCQKKPMYIDFDAQQYLKASYGDPRGASSRFCPKMRHFLMSRIHNFYNETLPHQIESSRRLLEFGGGPVIATVISAVPHVQKIVFSDYLRCNLEAVEAWRDDHPTAYDWTPYFSYVLQDMEGNDDPDAAIDRSVQLRKKLSAFEIGDANADTPIGNGYQGHFDVLSMSFCFESACCSHGDVVNALLNLSQYLKGGSWIMINGVLGGSYYYVNGSRFFNLTQTKDTIRDSLAQAGFINIKVETFDNVTKPDNANYKGMYHATAQLQ